MTATVSAVTVVERFAAVVEERGEPRVLCLDPGGTTGYAAVWSGGRSGGLLGAGELVGHTWEQLDAVLEMWKMSGWCALVTEDFSLRSGLHRGAASKTDTLEPVRLNAALDYATYRMGKSGAAPSLFASSGAVRRQLPSVAKTLATDARLRAWGVYLPGDHARDAVRHAVLWLHTAGDVENGKGGTGRSLRAGGYVATRIDRVSKGEVGRR